MISPDICFRINTCGNMWSSDPEIGASWLENNETSTDFKLVSIMLHPMGSVCETPSIKDAAAKLQLH